MWEINILEVVAKGFKSVNAKVVLVLKVVEVLVADVQVNKA